jgi:hypothetical protein
MYLQEIFEVAVGLVFMWLVVSLAVMQFQEWIANLFKMRAKDMESAIRKMLTNDELATELYNHPLIASLSKKAKEPKGGEEGEKKNKPLPSYIPANKFALAMFDIVIKAGTEASPIQKAFDEIKSQFDSIDSPERRKLAEEDWKALLELAKRVATTQIGQQAVESVRVQAQTFVKDYPELDKQVLDLALGQVDIYYQKLLEEQRNTPPSAQDKELTLRQLRIGLLAMNSIYPNFKKSMGPLLTSVEEYVTEKERALALARTNVETWFNDSMDRLTGAYKRKTQLIAFFIGILLALLLNVDSIILATTLWREPTLRQAIVAQAQAYMTENPQGIAVTATPTATPETGAAPSASQPTADTLTPQSPGKTGAELQKELQALNIPFGWELTAFDTKGRICVFFAFDKSSQVFGFSNLDQTGQQVCKHVSNLPTDVGSWAAKIAGILMTGAAAAQGAPFWFDILKKLVNVRSTGPNPAEKPAG